MKKHLHVLSLALITSLAMAGNTPAVELLAIKPSHKVGVMPIKLSPEAVEMQRLRTQQLQSAPTNPVTVPLPTEVDLTMNNVPVLNQGPYATCVIFAVTAALDAAINKGDYISQLCLLQLSANVTQNTFWHSLWLGSSVKTSLSYISEYGIMTIDDQKRGSCNKIKSYPLVFDEKYLNYKMNRKDYHYYAENIYRTYFIEPQVLFMFAHAYSADDNTNRLLTLGNNNDGWITPADAFASIRKSLAEGNRVVLEFLFKGDLLRGGIKNTYNDTWFASNDLKSAFNSQHFFSDAKDWYFHEVVIYGYNDEIITHNSKGETQKGVFYVRNSWGEEEPEFMTYDFFKLMSMEATSINTPKQTH